jgi:cyclophilin family peptidyl-prolyl cis-trans isomerase
MTRIRWAVLAALALALAGCAGDGGQTENPTATLETNHGTVEILLYGNLTPQTVQNLGNLAQDDYYDETRIHRVVEDFVIQGGDPNTRGGGNESTWGAGGPGYTIEDEFACQDGTVSNDFSGYDGPDPCRDHGGLALSHDKAGMVSMANRGEARTGGSQFFITLAEQPNLDGTHPVFGEVVEGMDVVRNISEVPTEGPRDSRPQEDVIVHDVTIEGQLPGVDVDKFNQE